LAPPTRDLSPGGGSGRRRILLVDDEEDITDILKIGLERGSFFVDAYNDPRKALAELQPGRYDVAIFDIRMPVMDGFELYRRFHKVNSQTPVCFLTAFDLYESEFRRMFPDIHAAAFLKKPTTLAQLVIQLNGLLDGHENSNVS